LAEVGRCWRGNVGGWCQSAGMVEKNEPNPMFADLLREQHLVFTRRQLTACGISDNALRWRTRPGGIWQKLLQGVYLACTGTPTVDQLDMAALLFAGPGSVLTAWAAMRRLGLRVPRSADLRASRWADAVDVLVPASRRRPGNSFVRVHRTSLIPELVCVSGRIQFVWAARAVADAARGLKELREVRAVVANSVQRGWCRISELEQELRHGPAAGSALLRQAIAEVAGGVRSVAEADLLDLIKWAGLPMPMFNARLFVGTMLVAVADAWWPEARVAVEVDSREWHLSPEEWEETVRRHARMTAQGILVLHFTPKQIRTERAQVVATIRAALEAARVDSQPSVRALPVSG
jgi:very-short-patch-repair endonuclease